MPESTREHLQLKVWSHSVLYCSCMEKWIKFANFGKYTRIAACFSKWEANGFVICNHQWNRRVVTVAWPSSTTSSPGQLPHLSLGLTATPAEPSRGWRVTGRDQNGSQLYTQEGEKVEESSMCEPTKSTLRLDHTTDSCQKFISGKEILLTVTNLSIQTFSLLAGCKVSISKFALKAEGKVQMLTFHLVHRSHHTAQNTPLANVYDILAAQ